MRGNLYHSGRRRTGSILLTVAAGIALGVVLILASVSTAYAKVTPARAPQTRPPVVIVIVISHALTVKYQPVAHAAGHKIA